MNSRDLLRADERPTNSSRGRGLPLELPYKPGFVDNTDLEEVKMAMDKELAQIAQSFYSMTERLSNLVDRVDKLENGEEPLPFGLISVLPLGSNGEHDFGVETFPRKVSIQCSVGSGYLHDAPTKINVNVNDNLYGTVEAAAVNVGGTDYPITIFRTLSVDIDAGDACKISVDSEIGNGGSTSALVIVKRSD